MISARPSAVKQTTPREFAVRFLFGGICTAVAGLIAERFGPGVGGVFLAFPAIFPASACLIEKHERKRKEAAGMEGVCRGRAAAGLDAAGAALGAVALGVFATVVWFGLPRSGAVAVIAGATVSWGAVAFLLWTVRRYTAYDRSRRAAIARDRNADR